MVSANPDACTDGAKQCMPGKEGKSAAMKRARHQLLSHERLGLCADLQGVIAEGEAEAGHAARGGFSCDMEALNFVLCAYDLHSYSQCLSQPLALSHWP